MSYPVTTSGSFLSSTRLEVKRGQRFTVTYRLPATDGVSWTGATGKSQIRNADGTLLYQFSDATASVNTDGSADLIFNAPSSATLLWLTGVYWWDAFWQLGSTYGPTPTKTYKLTVSDGPTDL